MTREELAALRELADDLGRIVQEVSTRDGDATARQHQRARAVRSALDLVSTQGAEIARLRTALEKLERTPLTEDAERFLRLLLSECGALGSGADHGWRRCKRCQAFNQLQNHDPLARRLVEVAAQTLAALTPTEAR
jgi:hypothetical protein